MMKSLASSMKPGTSSQKHPALLNGIFKLNNDCLSEVFKYLPEGKVRELTRMDQRFRPSAFTRLYPEGLKVIDKEFLEKFPLNTEEWLYEAYGARATRMEFKSLSEAEFSNVYRHFPNLNEIVLRKIAISNIQPLPTALTSLELNKCTIADNVLQNWFAQVSGTLTELRLVNRKKEITYGNLENFSHLTSLSLDGLFPADGVRQLLSQNKATLRKLKISAYENERQRITPKEMWNEFSELTHLTELYWNYGEINSDTIDKQSKVWPELTFLELDMWCPEDFVKHLACTSTLTSLAIKGQAVDPHILKTFSNLRHLDFRHTNWYLSPYNIKGLSELQQVHSIDLSGVLFNPEYVNELIDLVKMLPPQVMKLDLNNIVLHKAEERIRKGLENALMLLLWQRKQPFEFRVSVHSTRFIL